MTYTCDICSVAIKTRQHLTCLLCNRTFDLECGQVPFKRYYQMSTERKREWTCSTCFTSEKNNCATTNLPRPLSPISQQGNQGSNDIQAEFYNETHSPDSNRPNTDRPFVTNDVLFYEIQALRNHITQHFDSQNSKISEVSHVLNELKAGFIDLSNKYNTLRTDADLLAIAVENTKEDYNILKTTTHMNSERLNKFGTDTILMEHDLATSKIKVDTIEAKLQDFQFIYNSNTESHTLKKIYPQENQAISLPNTPEDVTINVSRFTDPHRSTQKRQVIEPASKPNVRPSINIPQSTKSKNMATNKATQREEPTLEKSVSIAFSPLQSKQIHSDRILENGNETFQQENQWQIVKSKRFRQGVIRGKGKLCEQLQTVERTKKIHACFFTATTTTDAIIKYMKTIRNRNDYQVMKLKLKHERYASFVLTVPESAMQQFMTPEAWPAGTEVCEWFPRNAGHASRQRRPNIPGETTTKGN